MMRYTLLVLLLVGWCTLHSSMICLPATEYLHKKFPIGFRFYRVIYNIIAVATLAPVLLYGAHLKGPTIIAWAGPWRIVPVLLVVTSLFFFIAGARRYDLLQLIGIRQIKGEKTCSVLSSDCSLDTGGVLSIVRHPWYTGGILIIWARPLDMAAILTNLVIYVYFVVGTILEERKLRLQFGPEYEEYCRRVSMFFPVKWAVRLIFRNE